MPQPLFQSAFSIDASLVRPDSPGCACVDWKDAAAAAAGVVLFETNTPQVQHEDDRSLGIHLYKTHTPPHPRTHTCSTGIWESIDPRSRPP